MNQGRCSRFISAWKVRSTGEGVERPFQERAESERIDSREAQTYGSLRARKEEQGRSVLGNVIQQGRVLKGVSRKVLGQIAYKLLSPGRRGCGGENRANPSSADDFREGSFNRGGLNVVSRKLTDRA